jgi:hypothetical protein
MLRATFYCLAKEAIVAVMVRLIQQYHPGKKEEFHTLEKQFAELEQRGILPRGERLVPISGREPANTIIWQCRFDSLCAAASALRQIDSSAEHTELASKQHPMFRKSWIEFYDVLDY